MGEGLREKVGEKKAGRGVNLYLWNQGSPTVDLKGTWFKRSPNQPASLIFALNSTSSSKLCPESSNFFSHLGQLPRESCGTWYPRLRSGLIVRNEQVNKYKKTTTTTAKKKQQHKTIHWNQNSTKWEHNNFYRYTKSQTRYVPEL